MPHEDARATRAFRGPHAAGYISRALPLLGNLTDHGGTLKGSLPRGSTAKLFFALVSSPWLPPEMRSLPVVEVGANDGVDFAIPIAKHGTSRLYTFEPGGRAYASLTANLNRASIPWVDPSRRNAFKQTPPGSVSVFAYHAAVSNVSGSLNLTEAMTEEHNFANTLNQRGLPNYIRRTRQVRVNVMKLDEVLAEERLGVLMLKLDVQGHEYHVLRGAERYILHHPVPAILLEFTPKMLLAAGVMPIQLLNLLHHTLGYQCFDLSPPEFRASQAVPPLSRSFDAFLEHYAPKGPNFGMWTDLLCLNFAVL